MTSSSPGPPGSRWWTTPGSHKSCTSLPSPMAPLATWWQLPWGWVSRNILEEQELCLTKPKKYVWNHTKTSSKFRKALSLPFSTACGVHFGEMTRDEFRETVNLNWNWLDGTSLLWMDQKYSNVFWSTQSFTRGVKRPTFSYVFWKIPHRPK